MTLCILASNKFSDLSKGTVHPRDDFQLACGYYGTDSENDDSETGSDSVMWA